MHDLIGSILGQQYAGQQHKEKNTTRPWTEEQGGERACALTARRSISTAVKGLVGGAAAGLAEQRKHWTTAMIPRSSRRGTLHRRGASSSSGRCQERRQIQESPKRHERTRT